VALSDKIVGMHFRYPDHYEVGREKVREYAEAVKNDDPSFFEDEAAAELGYCGVTVDGEGLSALRNRFRLISHNGTTGCFHPPR